MMHPKDYLRQIGLSPSEAVLYIAGLKHPGATVSSLMQQTNLKRPTVYHGLDGLVEKGLATAVKEGKELRYRMQPADQIEQYLNNRRGQLQRQTDQLEALLPLFPTAQKTTDQSSATRQFKGEEQVRQLIDLALYCRSKRWDIVAPRQNFIAESDAAYIEYFKRTRQEQNIQSRTLWEGRWEDGKVSLASIVHRKPRYLPREYDGRFKAMMILFDQQVAIIGSYQQAEGLLIASKEAHELQTLLFEALWAQSKKP